MDLQQSEFDRLLFFEHARKTAEAEYTKNPLDADVRFFFLFFEFLSEDRFMIGLFRFSL